MPLSPVVRLIALLLLAACAHGESLSVDVAVYSGVPCGIASAIAASREGASVVLIEPFKHVGGLSTSGINTAETEHMLKWTFGGIAQEFYQRLGQKFGTGKAEYYFLSSTAEQVYREMLAEAKVPVRYGVRVEKVEKSGPTIKSITLSDGTIVEAKVFIDAGYEGDLMARAGVKFAVGRESRVEFGEEAAGVRFDAQSRAATTVDEKGALLPGISGWTKDLREGDAHPMPMNYNFRLTVTNDPALRVPFPQPAHYDRSRYRLLENWIRSEVEKGKKVSVRESIIDFYKRRAGRNEMNNKQNAIISLGHFGGQIDYPDADYATRDKVIADHWDYTLGLLHFLATEEVVPENARAEMQSWGLHKEEFTDNSNLPYQLYVREARRMRGAYVVRQQDVQDERHKDDAIAVGSHFIDCHHVQRLAVSPTEFVNEGRIWRRGRAYQIPYRALTPRAEECTNLLVPGAASYTHVAFCTYRLESTWMMAGHAAGVAASMLAKTGQPVQMVDVAALQDQLRKEGQVIDFITGQPEEFPGDEAGYKFF